MDLYNHAYWWEAHEAWEGLWLAADGGPTKDALQGMIQVAAMHLRIDAGERDGVVRLLERARVNLSGVLEARAPVFAGIAMRVWWQEVVVYQATCLNQAIVAHAEAGFPYLNPV
ncbi:MAG: DUF309 domain-containing protein [Phycisphaerales bacterium]